jgi:hypothetical protein
MQNIKTKITQIHYQRDPSGIVFEILNYTINNEIKTNDDATLIALKIKMI